MALINHLPSDNLPMEVRTLGLFDLDEIAPEDIGRYAYEMVLASGEKAMIEFPIERYQEPPPEPGKPQHEIEEKTADWYKLITWQRYQAAVSHEKRRAERHIEYVEAVSKYILEQCVSKEDRSRILTQEDWEAVYWVALVPQLTMELIVATLRKTLRASYDDEEVFAALSKASGGKGVYDGLRVWEIELMISMGMSEAEYSLLPLAERARKVCGQQIKNWLGFLEIDDQRKKMEIARAQAGAKAKA